MDRATLEELHYMTSLRNVAGIMRRGILCHEEAQKYNHVSIANPEVQSIRSSIRVPGGLMLHEYANLYVSARNAMLSNVLDYSSKQPKRHLDVCVLRVSPRVLELPDVVIADANAAAGLTLFWPSPEGIEKLDQEIIFAKYWTDPDPSVAMIKKQRMMAEVLVPERVSPEYIEGGGYVCCRRAAKIASMRRTGATFAIKPYMFFNTWGRFHR
jgi:hypothetical protein